MRKKRKYYTNQKKLPRFNNAFFLCAVFAASAFVAGILAKPASISAYHATSCTDVNTPLSDFVVDGVSANKADYVSVMNQTGVPWELLAAIHYRETSFSRSNPSNGQGIFQFVNGEGGPYPAGPVSSSEFRRQLKFMATKLQNDYVWRGSVPREKRKLRPNETNLAIVKDTLFSYNGRSSAYIDQAAHFGYSKTSQPYEGSPYVMNRFDCKRARMGIITQDYGSLDGRDTRYGAFTIYHRLAHRVDAVKFDANTDKTGEAAKIGFRLNKKPTSNVTISYKVSSPSNARIRGSSSVTITPTTWNKPSSNTITVVGLNNPDLTGSYQYELIPAARPVSSDSRFSSINTNQLGNIKLVQLDTKNPQNVYRLYSSSLQQHYFTASKIERDTLVTNGWTDEGVKFMYCQAGEQTVLRYVKENERRLVIEGSSQESAAKLAGFALEKATLAASKHGTVPVYWRYNPTAQRSLYTTSTTEATDAPWVDKGIAFYACKSSEEPVYRLYRSSNNSHFLTTSASERDSAIYKNGYRYENLSFYICSAGNKNIYRLYRKSNHSHFYTASASERDAISRAMGYVNEGTKFKICTNGESDVHRLYRKSNNSHFFTTSESESNSLKDEGFRYEGIKFNAE